MNILNKLKWLIKKKDLSKIKLIVLDVDGVLTDGFLIFNYEGKLSKRFCVKDGLGIRILQENFISIIFLSGGTGGATEERARQLNIKKCITNVKDKEKELRKVQKDLGFKKEETLFVGDDINDLVVKDSVNLLIAPNDASNFIKRKAHLILTTNGGEGAIRELAEKILDAKGVLNSITNLGWKDLNN